MVTSHHPVCPQFGAFPTNLGRCICLHYAPAKPGYRTHHTLGGKTIYVKDKEHAPQPVEYPPFPFDVG